MSDVTFSMFSAPESRTVQRGLGLTPPAAPPRALTEKYRPARFAEIVGQGAAVLHLTKFTETPYPTAFVFAGETGTGKTSAAVALANELGVDLNWSLHRISAGEMDAEAVTFALKSLRFVAPGSGWKVVICDEADSMSPKAKQMWLSALEDLPEKSVIIFTTNHLSRFEQRFLDRCELVKFASDATTLTQDAQALFNRLWAAEQLAGLAPDVRTIPDLVDQKGAISFRRVVRAIEQAKLGLLSPRPATIETKPIVSLARKEVTCGS
jgi:replication-associated recombination protein RarA